MKLQTELRTIKRIAYVSVLGLGYLAAGGCISIEWGSIPLTDRLDQLEIGVSERADVLLVLGEPRGEGGAEFIQQQGRPRDAWMYDFARSKSGSIESKLLVVFFEDEKFDGYLWFSAIAEERG